MGAPVCAEEIQSLLADEEHCVLELQNLGENLYEAMPRDLKDCIKGFNVLFFRHPNLCNSVDYPSAKNLVYLSFHDRPVNIVIIYKAKIYLCNT